MNSFEEVSDFAIRTSGECKKLEMVKQILKENYRDLIEFPLLQLIDDKKLSSTPASVLGGMIDNDMFSAKEKASIREKRRKLINIKTANNSRLKALKELEDLEKEITKLQECKNDMKIQEEKLKAEIKCYKAHLEVEFQSCDQQLNYSLSTDLFYTYLD
ncbi:hypothetical protein LOD99_12629 [Oopsacas minuta]|uniref:Basic leucine zipper domain-containing protein n=1 Tax=Oopsacas minuta TaxID=111878 RepID=A0AAV7JCU3_9METZ|nr:hypothetical protein LOD99_12629 [Oopsacas minuta]